MLARHARNLNCGSLEQLRELGYRPQAWFVVDRKIKRINQDRFAEPSSLSATNVVKEGVADIPGVLSVERRDAPGRLRRSPDPAWQLPHRWLSITNSNSAVEPGPSQRIGDRSVRVRYHRGADTEISHGLDGARDRQAPVAKAIIGQQGSLPRIA